MLDENISKGELGLWALAKPCQIVPLATIVVHSKAGLDIFQGLETLPALVDAVLELKPAWLECHPHIKNGVYPDSLADSGTLVSSRSSRHGTSLALKSGFVQQAAETVIGCPNEASLRCLSHLCAALENNILVHFNEDLLTRLSSQCKSICTGFIGVKNDIEIMLAQDVLAQLANAFQIPQTPSKSSLETPLGARFSEGCRNRVFKLFSESNASTTLKLTVLRLSVFCSEERGSSVLVALEGIRLAQRIIAPIAIPIRQQWAQKNPRLIEKFFSRLGRESLDLNTRLEVSINPYYLNLEYGC